MQATQEYNERASGMFTSIGADFIGKFDILCKIWAQLLIFV